MQYKPCQSESVRNIVIIGMKSEIASDMVKISKYFLIEDQGCQCRRVKWYVVLSGYGMSRPSGCIYHPCSLSHAGWSSLNVPTEKFCSLTLTPRVHRLLGKAFPLPQMYNCVLILVLHLIVLQKIILKLPIYIGKRISLMVPGLRRKDSNQQASEDGRVAWRSSNVGINCTTR